MDIRFRAIGEWREMSPPLLSKKISALEEETKERKKYLCTIGLAYDGVWDMKHGIEKALESNSSGGTAVETFANCLPSGFLPDIDLQIRTGEPHISGGAFMWQMKNAHLYFTETLWPDFGLGELERAIQEFKSRERRFGK